MSRVRQALDAAKAAQLASMAAKKHGRDESDLDGLLTSKELGDLKTAFYTRQGCRTSDHVASRRSAREGIS